MSTTIQSEEKKANPFPLLETGYHFTVSEFHERYKLLPETKHAELIEGIVYMASPISLLHSVPHSTMNGLCMLYAAETPGLEASANGTVILDEKNEYEPDGFIRRLKGGGTRAFDEHYLQGGPEFVFEISNTSRAMDLNEKFAVYERNSVQEYLVWQVQEQKIDLFAACAGKFSALKAGVDGVLRSNALPGFWLDVRAMVNGQNSDAIKTLRAGLETKEHADFVKRLSQGGK